MSIEFQCSRCSRTLRVADSTAGKKCKCPSCRVTLSIPGSPLEEILDSKIEINYPQCSTVFLSAPELEGTRGLCKGCGHVFTLSYDPYAAGMYTPSMPAQRNS
jgi:Zn-finger nucleic acid-binding protein